MGLGIRYEMQLPGATPARRVHAILARLHAFACTLIVDGVGPITRASLGELLRASPIDASDLERHFHEIASANLYEVDVALERVEHRTRRAVAGFSVHPGRGCEAAAFGFVRPGLTAAPAGFNGDLPWNGWSWSARCETQYASIVSIEHLIDCHLAVVHLLDEADRLGVTVHATDSTEYWHTRSVQHLIQHVDSANGIVARLL